MKVLLITGLLAKDLVTRYARESTLETSVLCLNMSVAALLTPKMIAQELQKVSFKDFDMILLPGLVRGDISVVEAATGVPTFKGPRYAADLPAVLDSLGKIELSKVVPACDFLRDEIQRRALQELADVERGKDALLRNPGNMVVGGLAIGKDFPIRVMGEIIDAPLLSNEQIQDLARRYISLGADLIDVGMIAGEIRPLDARRVVEAVKAVVDVPVSIDTLDPQEAREAILGGADMLLSIDAGNMHDVFSFASRVAVVVIPTNHRRGIFPKKAEERVRFLEENIREAERLGFTKIVADPILDPVNVPGVTESVVAFHMFAKNHPNIPLLMGVGNVSELMDADSVGVNALVAGIASEIGVSVLLSTEKSDKAKGSVKELATASRMMFLARRRGSAPKDLGLDLLILKDKRIREEPYRPEIEAGAEVVDATEKIGRVLFDPKGYFKILIDRSNRFIVAIYYSAVKRDSPSVIVKGRSAEEIYGKIVDMNLMSRLDHAAYLGSELAKAEIALRTGKEYIQDSPVFGTVDGY